LVVRRPFDSLIRRETRILAALCAIAIVGFFTTRALAAVNRRVARSDAARWQTIGETRLAAGDAAGAVEAFRAAALIDRDDRDHRLALADALRRTGDSENALDVLVRLREALPEDVGVNTRLARLAAARGDVEDAVRYYQTALLALWPPSRIDERRSLRVELIEFLLDRGAASRALSEALKFSGEIADEPAPHVQAGRLFLRADSPSRAAGQFVAALRLDPDDGDAIAGAGVAAFDAGDYERAREFLARAPAESGAARRLLLVDLILGDDPLLPHLTARGRSRRLVTAVDALAARLIDCPAGEPLRQDVAGLAASLTARRATSADSLGADLGHLARVARQAAETCAPEQPIDRAVLLIARRHGVEPQ
jgi:Flp pilus assembly protein TadD